MRVPPVLLLLCLCTGFAAALWWWPTDDGPPPPTAGDDLAAVTPAPAAPVAELGPAVAAAPTLPEDGEAEDGAGEERTDASTAADQRLGPRLLVVRGAPPVPVAGAEVFVVTEADAEQRQRLRREQGQRSEWPERYGQRLTTDPQGLAQLPPTERPWLASALAGGEFGFIVVPPGRRTVTLELLPDETVRVLAETAEGAPGAALPVALLQHRQGQNEAEVLWQGVTDREGLALCRHFQIVRPALRGSADGERFAAMLEMSLPAPVVATFPGRPAGPEPVRLVVPPHTQVEVQLTDHAGAPLLSPANVALWVERPRDFVLSFPVPNGLDRPRLDKPVGTAPVVFPRIAIQSPVRLAARFPGERRGALSGPLWTPPDPQEPLRTRLPLAPDLALLAGRIVTADGKPFGPAELRGSLWRADRPLGELTVHTMADGRFDYVQRPLDGVAELWLEVRTELPLDLDVEVAQGQAIAPVVRREVGARVHFQALRAGERKELGTLVLDELPPIGSGIVVDDLGEPIANAEVKLQRRDVAPAPPPPGPRAGPRPQAAPTETWRDLPLLSARCDEAGRFVLRGERPGGELRVRADSDRHFADALPLRSPGQELRIVLQRNGILRGRVLLPDWIADGTVSLQLRPFDEAVRERDGKSLGLQRRGGGRFTLEPLRPGRYDAIVMVRNVAEPLCVLQDLFVTPGEVRDVRLRPLDLRQALFRYRLRAVDPGGRTLGLDGPILARLRKQDGGIVDAGFRWQKGRAELITGSSLAELVAFGTGCEPTTVTLGPGDHDIYMRQVQPALVYLPGARALCGPSRRVRVSVVLTEETGFPQWLQGQDQRTGESFSFPRWELGKSNGAWLGASDNVEIPIARSGKYEVILRLHATDSERSPQASVPLGVHELRVDAANQLPVTVPIEAAKVQAAIEQLQAQQAAAPAGGQGRNRRGG